MEKKCTKCGQIKDISKFRRDIRARDGLRPECAKCQTEYNIQRYGIKKDEIIDKITKYRNTPKGKEVTKKSHQAYYKKNAKDEIYKAKQRSKIFIDQYKAHHRIAYMIKRGDIPPAKELDCVVCGNQAKDYHHHKGYEGANAFDVIPVCRKCHAIIENHL